MLSQRKFVLQNRFEENEKDLAAFDSAQAAKLVQAAKYDRLKLTEKRVEDLAKSVEEVAVLPDPNNVVLLEKTLANGLIMRKLSVALGVVGVGNLRRGGISHDGNSVRAR